MFEKGYMEPEINIDRDLVDYFLTPKELADVLGITVQGLHKICHQHQIKTQDDQFKGHRIYPSYVRQLLKVRNICIPPLSINTFHSVKGGPGKTTLAHTMGSRASAYGFRTLVIDLDKQANLTNSFGIDDEDPELLTMMDVYLKYKETQSSTFAKEAIIPLTDYLHLLPANIELANFDLGLQTSASNLPKLFRKIMSGIVNKYDLIFIDLPPDFNRVTIAAHCFSSTVFIPVNMNAFSLKGIKLTLEHLDFINEEFGISLTRKFVPNRVDARTTSAYEILLDLKSKFEGEITKQAISICKPLEDSFLKRVCAWKVPRAKPALDSIDAILCTHLGIDSWKKHKLKQESRSREVVQNV